MRILFCLVLSVLSVFFTASGQAQTLTTSNVQIEWKVINRFRLFADGRAFQEHENAWRQYLIHVNQLQISEQEKQNLIAASSVIGAEHVLNDRFISFTKHLRNKYDWRGWAARQHEGLCWDPQSRSHAACGGVSNYVMPAAHDIEVRLKQLTDSKLISEYNCIWRVGEGEPVTAACDEAVVLSLPYPDGGSISVNVEGEQPISVEARVKDLLVVGLGDSFASGEGNPDVPVILDNGRKFRNFYPARVDETAAGNAKWMDELCHRSLYGHQLRAALQIAIENPRAAVTFMGYACSGASIEDGIIGPQYYVSYRSDGRRTGEASARRVSGGNRDTQLSWLLEELCKEKPARRNGLWTCPDNAYRRPVDFVLLSVGGNDIGFSNLVTWVTLRKGPSSRLAGWLGTTVSPDEFAANMKNILPSSYAHLAKAMEAAIPLRNGDLPFDPSRVIVTAYPDILADEKGNICAAGKEDEDEDLYPANQSLDLFSSWLVVTEKRLASAHAELEKLHNEMSALAGDHGWTFAGRAYADKPFQGHGFCAQKKELLSEPSEQLNIPCWGKAPRPTATCETNWSGKERSWRPYDPQNENYPYALRQRWVRTFNDAYMIVNEKVMNRDGYADNRSSETVFSETTGAMHPSAEGNAAMADAILMDIRKDVEDALSAP